MALPFDRRLAYQAAFFCTPTQRWTMSPDAPIQATLSGAVFIDLIELQDEFFAYRPNTRGGIAHWGHVGDTA